MKTAVKNTFLIISLSLVLSLLFGLPHILISNFLQDRPYSPLIISEYIPSYTIDETYVYAAKTQEALRGSFFLSDAPNYEYQDLPTLHILETIPAKIMAALSLLFGSVPNAFIASDFIFPVINFLLVAFFINIFTNNFKISVIGSVSTICGSYLLKLIQYPRSFFINLAIDFSDGRLTLFARSFHPQISFVFVSIAMIFLFLTLLKKSKIYLIMLGISTGLLFYTYIYYLAFFGVGIIFVLIFLLLFKEKEAFKRVVLSIPIALIISIPFFITLVEFINIGLFNSMKENYTHTVVNTFWLSLKIILTLILINIIIKSNKIHTLLLNAFLFSCLFLINIQFVIGSDIRMAEHIDTRIAYPLFAISIFLMIFYIKINYKIKNFILGACLIFSFLYIFLIHFSYSKNYFQYYTLPENEKQMFSWLSQNTPKGSVVMTASLKYNLLLLSLTHNKVFIPHGFLSYTPSREILERTFITNKFLGFNNDKIKSLFEETPQKIKDIKDRRWHFDYCGHCFVYNTRYSKGGNYYQCFSPTSIVSEIVREYQNYPFDKDSLTKYKADYLLVGPYETSSGFEKDVFEEKYRTLVKPVFENKDYKIYSLRN